MKIGVAGCVAQAEGDEIKRRMPLVDIVVGSQAYHRLPEMVRGVGKTTDTDFPVEDKFDLLPKRTATAGPHGLSDRARGLRQVLRLLRRALYPWRRSVAPGRPHSGRGAGLVEKGVRDITLLGQNVNAYHAEGYGFARLIRDLARVDGLQRIRYMTSHPNDMEDDLIAAHGDEPKLMPYLHLPVQSGSDRILKAMNRKHTAEQYLRADRTLPRRPARHSAVVGFHRRLSRRNRRRPSGHPGPDPRGGLWHGLQLQILAPPRHARGRKAGTARRCGRRPPA